MEQLTEFSDFFVTLSNHVIPFCIYFQWLWEFQF